MGLTFSIIVVVAILCWIFKHYWLYKIKKEKSLGKLLEYYAVEEADSDEKYKYKFTHPPDYKKCSIISNGFTIISSDSPAPELRLKNGLIVPRKYQGSLKDVMSNPTAWGESLSFITRDNNSPMEYFVDIIVAVDVDFEDDSPQDTIRGYIDFLLGVKRNLGCALAKYCREADAALRQSR